MSFTYGQMGAGKTWTMACERSGPELAGVIPNSFKHISDHISRLADEEWSLWELLLLHIWKLSKSNTKPLMKRSRQSFVIAWESRHCCTVYVQDLKVFVAKNADKIEIRKDQLAARIWTSIPHGLTPFSLSHWPISNHLWKNRNVILALVDGQRSCILYCALKLTRLLALGKRDLWWY